jgi:hypothetical protein
LKGQLAALRASEEWHRQIQKPEFQRELRLQQFRANGLSSTEEAFLLEHLELVDRPDLLAAAHQAAVGAGHRARQCGISSGFTAPFVG